MLTLTGDILNWAAAGIVFPLMFLPIAALIAEQRRNSFFAWIALVFGSVAAGALFAALAPILRETPAAYKIVTFTCVVAALAFPLFMSGPAKSAIEKLSPLFENITRNAGRAVMWLLLVMVLMQFSVVVMRYVFGINFIFMQESITYMHGAVFLVAGGYALLTNDHVRVDIFYREASPKRKALIDFLGTYLFLFPICLILLWTASPYVAQSWSVNEGSTESSGIQGVYLLKSLIPAFAVLLAMAGFVISARAGDELKGRG